MGYESDSRGALVDFRPLIYPSLKEAMSSFPGLLVDMLVMVHATIVIERVGWYVAEFKEYLRHARTFYAIVEDEAGALFLLDCTLYDLIWAERYLTRSGTPFKSVRGPAGCNSMLRGWP